MRVLVFIEPAPFRPPRLRACVSWSSLRGSGSVVRRARARASPGLHWGEPPVPSLTEPARARVPVFIEGPHCRRQLPLLGCESWSSSSLPRSVLRACAGTRLGLHRSAPPVPSSTAPARVRVLIRIRRPYHAAQRARQRSVDLEGPGEHGVTEAAGRSALADHHRLRSALRRPAGPRGSDIVQGASWLT